MNEKILRFVLKTKSPANVMDVFFPGGHQVLNRTEWMGKEPRSCAVTKCSSREHTANSPDPVIFDIEVSYRPKGYISYCGNTQYNGWECEMLDRMKDGTLLDGKGQPLNAGEKPVHLQFKAYADLEFRELEFGEFIGEFDGMVVQHETFDAVMALINEVGQKGCLVSCDISGGGFVAAHRQRPNKKILVTSRHAGEQQAQFGGKCVLVPTSHPHVETVLMDELTKLMGEFIEGKIGIKSMSAGDMTFVELSDSLVDCELNEQGGDSIFDVLSGYVPITFLDELAKRMMTIYEVKATVVGGQHAGLLLHHDQKQH